MMSGYFKSVTALEEFKTAVKEGAACGTLRSGSFFDADCRPLCPIAHAINRAGLEPCKGWEQQFEEKFLREGRTAPEFWHEYDHAVIRQGLWGMDRPQQHAWIALQIAERLGA